MDSICNDISCHPTKYSIILYKTSWIYLFASLFGFYKKIYDLAIYTSIVWLTCLNYWNNPKNKFNYYLDIIAVRSGILYHIIRAPDAENYLTFYKIFTIGLLFYIPSRYYFIKEKWLLSTIFHAGLHIITGISLIYLYSNKIKSFYKSYLLSLIYKTYSTSAIINIIRKFFFLLHIYKWII